MSINSYAQNPAFFKIGEKEFANTDVYSLLLDEQSDLIYAATNRGLFVYKEGTFLKLKEPKNMIGRSLFELKQDNFGAIYCKNLNGQIFRINESDNSFEIYYDLITRNTKGNSLWYFFTPKNNLVVANNNNLIEINNSTKRETIILDKKTLLKDDRAPVNIHRIFQNEAGIFISIFASNLLTYNYNDSKLTLFNTLTDESIHTKSFLPTSHIGSVNGSIFSIDQRGELTSYNSKITANFKLFKKEQFIPISQNSFVGLNPQKGYRYFTINENQVTASNIIFPQLFISSFYQSKNGTQLLGTFGEGVLIVPNSKIIKKEYEYLFQGIATSPNNDVYVSTRSGEVLKVDDESDLLLIDKKNTNIDNVWYLDKKEEPLKNNIYYEHKNNLISLKDVKLIGEEYLAYISNTSLNIEMTDQQYESSQFYTRIHRNSTRKVYFGTEKITNFDWTASDSTFYISSNYDFYSREWQNDSLKPILYRGNHLRVNDIISIGSTVVCATNKFGVLFYENKKFTTQLSETEGLNSNSVIQVGYKNDRLFILTKMGVQVYNLASKKMNHLGLKEGVSNNGIKKFALSDNKLWLLEKHSFFSIPFKEINKYFEKQPKEIKGFYFTELNVNSKVIDYKVENEFNHTANGFEFKFDYRDLLTKDEATILYSVSTGDEKWRVLPASASKVVFDYLPHGSYKFKIKAKYRNIETTPFTYQFKISPPFWSTWWFWSVLFLLFFCAIVLYYTSRIKKIRKIDNEHLAKQKLLTDAVDSKLKALRSQMNPHFIFNSLNSIQALILKQETEKSYDYIVLFSDLVRKTLEYSDTDFISVESELDFLESYLTLESLRMKEEFTYSVKYIGDMDLRIPSLMVQPFIENAIHHGLLHKSGAKTLTVLFEFDTEMTCIIIDNGIGREKAREIKKRQNKSHRSFSLAATKQRMEILKKQHNTFTGYQIIDLYENSAPIGTKVIMKLPFNHKY